MMLVEDVVRELRRVEDLGSVWLRHGRRGTPTHMMDDLGFLELCDPPTRILWAMFDGGEYARISPAGRAFLELAARGTSAAAAALRLLEEHAP